MGATSRRGRRSPRRHRTTVASASPRVRPNLEARLERLRLERLRLERLRLERLRLGLRQLVEEAGRGPRSSVATVAPGGLGRVGITVQSRPSPGAASHRRPDAERAIWRGAG
jgi:hypothetical protein